MRSIISRIIGRSALLCALVLATIGGFVSCEESEDQLKSVDLRYTAEEKYTLEASGADAIRFMIKSTDPWTVYSHNNDWCDITPSEGGAGDKFDVEIAYTDNTELDDRTDTIVLKSDYWIGRWVQVLQKGIAFLEVDMVNDTLPESVSEGTFNIESNQDWSVVISEEDSWLSITEGASGSINGAVKFSTIKNNGATRDGAISVLDRHGVERAVINITQKGIVLNPEKLEYRVAFDIGELKIPVVSNTQWSVVKDDETLGGWYNFTQTSFDGNNELVITLDNYTGTKVRKATFTIQTVSSGDIVPIKRTVTLKQSYYAETIRYEFDDTEQAKWRPRSGDPLGVISGGDIIFPAMSRQYYKEKVSTGFYTFNIKEMDPKAIVGVYFGFYNWGKEVKFFLEAGAFSFGASSLPSAGYKSPVVDMTQSNTVGVELYNGDNGYMNIAWYLNGKLQHRYENDGTVEIKNNEMAEILFGTRAGGSVTYDWWEYTESFDWGK